MTAQQLPRVALLTDTLVLPAWQLYMLESLLDAAELVVVIKLEQATASRADTGATHILWRTYMQLEERFLSPQHDPLEPRDASNLLNDVPIVKLAADAPDDAGLATLAGYQLDVIVLLNEVDVAPFTSLADHLWRYAAADALAARGAAGGARELLQAKGMTESSLLDAVTGHSLYSSTAPTHYLSVSANRRYLWKSALFVSRALRALARGELHDLQPQETAPPVASEPPGNLEMLRLGAGHLRNYLTLRFNLKRAPAQWMLLYKHNDSVATDLNSFKQLIPPADRFWADPFVVAREGKHYIFFEELFYSDYKGHISVLELDEQGVASDPVKVIEQPYHMSYPLLFEYEDELYMLPETAANNSLELYRCTDFPHGWVHHKTLMQQVRAFDATPHYHDRRWWLFVNMQAHPGISDWDELYVFYADSPLSEDWTAHPQNPVVSSVASARPAGHLFEQDGVLYRPSQDSSRGYGYGLKLNHVVTLTETHYQEETLRTLTPWDNTITATHTLNYAAGLTVADAMRRRR